MSVRRSSMERLEGSKRVNVTVPKDAESLFNWFRDFAPEFKGESEAAIAAHFLRLGLQTAYEQGLRNPDPLEPDEFAPLAEGQRRALNDALGDD
jgi:hypothetical protein